MKKTIVALFCATLSMSVFAAIDGLAANYTIGPTDIEPTDVVGELNDDPEQTAVATSTEKTTVDTDLVNKTSDKNKEWKSRKDSAYKRQKNDNTLKYN